ncbi:Alginate lyase [Planctomycetes bacterium MalM25]|nr:Alginate lyase [Planctomycetes bacterium MalM25]
MVSLVCLGMFAGSSLATPPTTVYWDGEHLERVRNAPAERDRQVVKSLKQLGRAAAEALRHEPYSVTDKDLLPPSGDKHDYMSFSRYWWPNPDTDDGLPYVRRDGVVNRELVSRGDRERLGSFCDDVEALALAAYLLDREPCAAHARRMLRVWFLDPETRMSPNLSYGQAVPGVSEGRGPGILDTRHFVRVIESVHLLESLGAIDKEMGEELREWFDKYLAWLRESDIGRHEQAAKNNHGVWYDAQTAAIAVFIGEKELARRILIDLRDRRLPAAVEPDGSQPQELRRTMSLHYSLFSLSAYAMAARVGEAVGLDLWRPADPAANGCERALRYAAPYVARQDEWPHTQIKRYTISDSQSHLFYLAASAFEDPQYLKLLENAPRRDGDLRMAPLLFARWR